MDSKNPSGAKGRAEVYDWIQCIIFALVFCVLLFVFAVSLSYSRFMLVSYTLRSLVTS